MPFLEDGSLSDYFALQIVQPSLSSNTAMDEDHSDQQVLSSGLTASTQTNVSAVESQPGTDTFTFLDRVGVLPQTT